MTTKKRTTNEELLAGAAVRYTYLNLAELLRIVANKWVAVAVPELSLEGLKEIGNLASWTVSTAKPGNGVEQLRDEDTSLFWQQVLHSHYIVL